MKFFSFYTWLWRWFSAMSFLGGTKVRGFPFFIAAFRDLASLGLDVGAPPTVILSWNIVHGSKAVFNPQDSCVLVYPPWWRLSTATVFTNFSEHSLSFIVIYNDEGRFLVNLIFWVCLNMLKWWKPSLYSLYKNKIHTRRNWVKVWLGERAPYPDTEDDLPSLPVQKADLLLFRSNSGEAEMF